MVGRAGPLCGLVGALIMAEAKSWYLVCYDIRCPKRWRKAYKLLQGYGDRLQLSIFRCWLSQRDREKLRWELSKILKPEDDLLILGVCDACVKRAQRCNDSVDWALKPDSFRML